MFLDLRDVKTYLRVAEHDRDMEIQHVIDDAEDIVLSYLKTDGSQWTQHTLPPRIRRAMLEVCIRLHDDKEGLWDGEILSLAVRQILHRDRDPALA